MDNKKLLKFLYKDIAEIEELVSEKGGEGFDEFEIEFIQSRFNGAKQLIQILSEKENKQAPEVGPRPVIVEEEEEIVAVSTPEPVEPALVEVQMSEVEKESLQELSEFEDELKEDAPVKEVEAVNTESNTIQEPGEKEELPEVKKSEVEELNIQDTAEVEEETVAEPEPDSDVELDEENEINEATHRLGDSFSKEKSINELLGNSDSQKLEYKISNSPVGSIKSAIGINDRYQYIRELFDGSSERFLTTVTEIDSLNDIQEAVNYLQQNYKWKKNDTSLKFVNLVKRRFSNGQ